MIECTNVRPEAQSIKGINQVNTSRYRHRLGHDEKGLILLAQQTTPVVDNQGFAELNACAQHKK